MSVYNFTVHSGTKKYKIRFDAQPEAEGEILGKYKALPYKGFVACYIFVCGASKDSMHAGSYCSTKDEFDELRGCRQALTETLYRYHFNDREKEVFWKAFEKRISIANQEIMVAIEDFGDAYQPIMEAWRQTGLDIGTAFAAFAKALLQPVPKDIDKIQETPEVNIQ